VADLVRWLKPAAMKEKVCAMLKFFLVLKIWSISAKAILLLMTLSVG
jgi:hypothetical protein